MWVDVAIVAAVFAVGNILFGHFEEGVPKRRRVLKFLLVVGLVAIVSAKAGRVWAYALLGVMLLGVGLIHAWWLPRHGVDGWTGEPREKYYELRGWKRKAPRGRES